MSTPPLLRIDCIVGDLTAQRVDAIVNAANETLRGGGGVDGAIHRAAGPGLLAECLARHPDGCPTGDARLTGGHALPARHVIHAVGPIWRGGDHGEPRLLASCHRRALDIAAAQALRTVAFPAISCGAYGYPHAAAAQLAIGATAEGLAEHGATLRVTFVLFTPDLHGVFARELAEQRRTAGLPPPIR